MIDKDEWQSLNSDGLTDAIETDLDVLFLVERYFEWRKENFTESGSGLDAMMALLKDTLVEKGVLREKLLHRFEPTIEEAISYASKLGAEPKNMLEYITNGFLKNPHEIDYDETYLFLLGYLKRIKRNLPKSNELSRVNSFLNTYFGNLEMRDSVFAYKLLSTPDEITAEDLQTVKMPMAIQILKSYFNLTLYTDSMQLGTNAWGNGKQIAIAIHNYISSESSIGQNCSLYPPDGILAVDWSKKQWIYASENREWLTEGFENIRELPKKFKASLTHS